MRSISKVLYISGFLQSISPLCVALGNPRRGFPHEKQSTGLFFSPPALFWGKGCFARWLAGDERLCLPTPQAFAKAWPKIFKCWRSNLLCANISTNRNLHVSRIEISPDFAWRNKKVRWKQQPDVIFIALFVFRCISVIFGLHFANFHCILIIISNKNWDDLLVY